MGHYYSQEKKEELVKQWQRSGLSRNEFSRQNNVSGGSLSDWKKKYTERELTTEVASDFVEIPFKKEIKTQVQFLRIRTKSGLVIEVPL